MGPRGCGRARVELVGGQCGTAYESRQANHATRSGRRFRHRRSFRSAGHAHSPSGRCRYRHCFSALAIDGADEREIRADVRAVTATEFATVLGDAVGSAVSPPPNTAGGAARPWRRQRPGRDRRPRSSDHGRQRRAFRRRDRSGRHRHAADAAPLYPRFSNRFASPRATPLANCGPFAAASASRPRSTSITR